jgi:hypothetical protein
VPLSTFLRGPELRRAIRHVDVDTLVAPATLLGRDTTTMLEDLFPELRSATDAQLFLPDAPFLRHVWLTGAASPSPWVTGCPSFVDLPDERMISDEVFEAVESEVAPRIGWSSSRLGATANPNGRAHTRASAAGLDAGAALPRLTADVRIFSTMPSSRRCSRIGAGQSPRRCGDHHVNAPVAQMFDLIERAPYAIARLTLRAAACRSD